MFKVRGSRRGLTRLKVAGVAIAVSLGLLVGTGSSATASTPVATASIGKAKFLKHGNAICVKRRESRQRAFNGYVQTHKGKGGLSQHLLNAAIRTTFPSGMNAEVAELRKLGVPAGDSDEVGAIEAAFAKSARKAAKITDSKSKAAFDEALGHAGKMAKNYGLVECASA